MKVAKQNKHKTKKYITLSEGIDFRRISDLMSMAGYRMNHATARNCLIKSMRNLLHKTVLRVGIKPTDELIDRLMTNGNVHESMCEVLYSVYTDCLKENSDIFGEEKKNGNRTI
jgi:GR25 family glycosyltransferase involved in LPS biosynthesis